METLLSLMGDPHLAVPTVHVAGTKGKGSTCAMIAAALAAHGVKTGLYTSPHLHTFRERIQVDGQLIAEDQFAGLIQDLWRHVETVASYGDRGTVTVFELLTAMAFEHFRGSGAGFQVIEVGLGGRLDATNLVRPQLAVITPVGLDHVAILGDTIPAIAAEKAGIIKPGAPVVFGRQVPEGRAVIVGTARRLGVDAIDALEATALEGDPEVVGDRQRFSVRTAFARYEVDLPLLGPHQADNARTAIASLEMLNGHGVGLRPIAVELGLASTRWPGRFQILAGTNPLVVVDGAHNADSAEALLATFLSRFPQRGKVLLVYGATRGHEPVETARKLESLKPLVVATRTRHPKAIDPVELAGALRSAGLDVTAVAPNTEAALMAAQAMAEGADIILAAGSLFVAAEVIEKVRGIRPELYSTLKGDMMPTITAPGV
ncbi:MAG: bifunctional folylpolyglutamate synthase/dihydrofolate synthase [Chloroflexi bacterium]|nr:bifunctional folylpolyglutamate synthase/dihydrofolate synthase [Chloroflexota bacterium]